MYVYGLDAIKDAIHSQRATELMILLESGALKQDVGYIDFAVQTFNEITHRIPPHDCTSSPLLKATLEVAFDIIQMLIESKHVF